MGVEKNGVERIIMWLSQTLYFEILKPGIPQEDLKALFPGLNFCPNVLSAEPCHCHALIM
jgi:hypothetical protein